MIGIKPVDYARDLTIEHVLPHAAGDPYWRERFATEKEVRQYANLLGNMALVSIPVNTRLGTLAFPEKKVIAIEEGAHEAALLASCFQTGTDWNKATIEARTAALVKRLAEDMVI